MNVYRGPIGGFRRWRIETQEGLVFRVEGELLHSRRGTALIYGCDCDAFALRKLSQAGTASTTLTAERHYRKGASGD